MKIEIGNIYHSCECGDFKVLSKDINNPNRHPYYIIKFLTTGYVTSARYDVINCGNVFDPYYPKNYGIGFLGTSSDGSILDKSMYNRWDNMLSRCYNTTNAAYNLYGGVGITVCDRWHCYANFLEDVKTLPGYIDMINNPNITFHLDKDILQAGLPSHMKVYSPQTCMFVPACVNMVQIAKDHLDDHSNIFHNVIEHHGGYNVEIQVNNHIYRIGRYKDPIIAANAANHARRILGLNILNTEIPYISQEEVNSQNIRTKKNVMANIIE